MVEKIRRLKFEYSSDARLGNLPLLCVSIGVGAKTAKGVIAVGNVSKGIISIGLVAMGGITLGLISLGLFVFGLIGAGLIYFLLSLVPPIKRYLLKDREDITI